METKNIIIRKKTQSADIFQTEDEGSYIRKRHTRQTQKQLEMRRYHCSHQSFLHPFLNLRNL